MITWLLILSLMILLAAATPAHAYLDPGSGSMFLQLLLGGLAGLLLAIKIFWHRILQLFGIKKKEENTEQKPDQPV